MKDTKTISCQTTGGTLNTCDAFVLEQPEDFSGEALRQFAAILPQHEDFVPLYVEGNNSSAVCLMNTKKLDELPAFKERRFTEKFRIELVRVLNDIDLEPDDHICDLNGVKTYIFRP